jgi:alcohol dehydrogenase class IV
MVRTFERQVGKPRIVFGAGALTRVADEVARLGGSRALVLSTPGRVDLAASVVETLGESVVGTFDGAAMHTPVDVTERAVSKAKAVGADCLVSVGGGSTTGLGKAVAVRTGLPHLVLPTTYAGSEVTPVLGETASGEKTTRSGPEVLPDTVVYDVELTTSLPWETTVTSVVNAMAHAVEALYAPERTPASDDTAGESLTELVTGLRALSQAPGSLDARDHLLFGAWLAGTCLATVGMGLHHKLCHTLGGSFGLPHAPTHTVVLPYVMEFNQPAAPEAIAAAGDALGVTDAAAGLQALIEDWGGPTTLAELGFSTSDASEAAALATARPYPNPRGVRPDDLADLLVRATNGSPIASR